MARLRSGRQSPAHHILAIDDDEILLESTRTLLDLDGHTLLCAFDPVDGIQIARTQRPDLILLDYFMPSMTGVDVVRAIREFDAYVQVLLVTGYSEEHPARKLLHEAADSRHARRYRISTMLCPPLSAAR